MEERPEQTGDPKDGVFYEEPVTRPAARRTFVVRMLAWLPMAFFAACLVLAMLAQPLARAVPNVPVTGGSLPPAPTLTPGGEPVLRLSEGVGLSYKEIAAARIHECTMAFHEFFILERMATNHPDMVSSDSWRSDAQIAMDDFESGCAPLGTLPDAPHAYAEADRWLKLAAGEVNSASTRFALLIEDSDAAHIEVIGEHVMKFLEFTHNAELIIDRLEERKEL